MKKNKKRSKVLYPNIPSRKGHICSESRPSATSETEGQMDMDDPRSSAKDWKNSLTSKNLDALASTGERKARSWPRKHRKSRVLLNQNQGRNSRFSGTAKKGPVNEGIADHWKRKQTTQLPSAIQSTDQYQKKKVGQLNRRKQLSSRCLVVAEPTKTEGARSSATKTQKAPLHSTNQDEQWKKGVDDYQDDSVEHTSTSTLPPLVLSQTAKQKKPHLKTTRINNQLPPLLHADELRKERGNGYTARQPHVYVRRAREVNDQTSLIRYAKPASQEESGIALRKMEEGLSVSPLAEQRNIRDRGKDVGETIVRRQWYIRPGEGRRIRPVGVTRDGHDDLAVVTKEEPAHGRSITLSNRNSQARAKQTEPLDNKEGKNGNQDAYQPQTKVRGQGLDTTQRRAGRRVDAQHGSNGYNCPAFRRHGLCTQTGPAQQKMTFIRVLRKRF